MAAALTSPVSPTQGRKKSIFFVTDAPKFDLDTYIQNYRGRTRYNRLLLIGVTSTFLCLDALKAAVVEAKKGCDVRRYVEALANLETVAPYEAQPLKDDKWLERVEQENAAETARLEAQLKGYKNNLIKESVRMGNEDLGKHFQNIGLLPAAFEAYSRMRTDVSIAKHIVDVSKHLIEVAIEQKNWIAVSSNVQKIRGVQTNAEDDKTIQPYLCAADGLAHMDSGDYYGAAMYFLGTDAGMGTSCNTIASPNDIAIYGGLCALATMHRNEMQTRVLENFSFRTYLELEPHIRRAITFFVNSRYSACLNVLESYRSDYLLDLHLHRHVEILYSLIRSKSIVQYFIPFSCVTLDSLNEAFAAPGKTIDKELIEMIKRGDLEARINTVDRLLVARPNRRRQKLYEEALTMSKQYEREACQCILRMNIIEASLGIGDDGSKRKKGAGGTSSFVQGQSMDDFLDFSSSSGAVNLAASGGRALRSRDGFNA